MNVALFTECLRALSDRLASREILVSDALISALKVLRIIFGAERLCDLNRELLGYLDEEVVEYENAGNETQKLRIPEYRMISGFWMPEFLIRRGISMPCGTGIRSSVFCNFGACELEQMLARMRSDDTTYVGIKINPDNGMIFMCRSSQLFRLYSEIRKHVCDKIDELVTEMG